jgi:hemerythrin-like domain-containing protein
MSRPTHLLRHEHRVIEQAMRALEGMCFHLRTGGRVPDEEMAKLFDFIRNFADGFHHAKEEAHLFPALAQIGIHDQRGPLAFLRAEHATEKGLLDVLELAVEAYRHNYDAGEQFVSAALQFKDHLVGHMRHEEAILFRLTEEMLDEEAADTLFRAFAEENSKAPEMIERYEWLAKELEETWSV